MKASRSKDLRLFTIGHSNRSMEEFWHLLEVYQIRVIADVRRFPSSRKFPHFNRDALRQMLEADGMQYVWIEALGGLRHTGTDKESPNVGLKSPAFRNYADHMMSEEFQQAVKELLALGANGTTAIKCAERFFWLLRTWPLSTFWRRGICGPISSQQVRLSRKREVLRIQSFRWTRGKGGPSNGNAQ